MPHDHEADLERGMRLVPKLPEIMPDQADERVRAIYQSMQRILRVPFVNFIFRTLANDPAYLEPAWNGLSSGFRTVGFERAADRLRAQALLAPRQQLPQPHHSERRVLPCAFQLLARQVPAPKLNDVLQPQLPERHQLFSQALVLALGELGPSSRALRVAGVRSLSWNHWPTAFEQSSTCASRPSSR
ncbi:MAG: halocarboxylic acid dehydrogenase DehI family protein [Trueperaceae bacterium]